MKIESLENGVRLVPENNWELEQLKRLNRESIDKVEFEDDWDEKGYLEISFKVYEIR